MKHYKIEAEHIDRRMLDTIADAVGELPHVEVMAIGMDDTFDRQLSLVVFAERPVKNEIRDIVWLFNNGAWCRQVEISEEAADEMC